MKENKIGQSRQSGQTLIETMAAVFVLAMGITAVVGLASYSFSSSSNVIKQVVGIGLARQGVEAVKNMRDTNWLQHDQIDTDCYNFTNQEATASCHRNWLDNASAYTLSNCATGCVLSFNPDNSDNKFPSSNDIKFWHLDAPGTQTGFTLFLAPLTTGTKYFYYPATSSADPVSGYYRSVTITQEASPTPFDKDGVGPTIRVISRVWWGDKKCPVPDKNVYPATGSCRVTLETLLTNWKTN